MGVKLGHAAGSAQLRHVAQQHAHAPRAREVPTTASSSHACVPAEVRQKQLGRGPRTLTCKFINSRGDNMCCQRTPAARSARCQI